MRTFFCISFYFLLTIVPLSGQQKFSFSFEEPFGSVNTSQSSRIVPPLQKSARLRSSRGGNLVAVIDATAANKLSPLCSSIIENALALWSEQLYFPNDNIVRINFKFGTINTGLAYRVLNHYIVIDGIAHTQAFAMAIKNVLQEEEIEITFNNDALIWYFEGDQEGVQNRYDFKTAVLRAVAQVLGFKSTLVNTSSPRLADFGGYRSSYDCNIVNSNNKKLSSFPYGQSADLTAYVKGNNVFWKTPGSGYRIYAPSTYKQGLSIDYFDSQGELMSYDFKSNECIWLIDNKVLQVMADIGWNLQNDQIKISSSGIDETGIASINNSYTFTASANGKAISNYQWEYRIKKTDGTYEIKGNANTSSFSISPITSSSQYARNSDGNIIGEINLTGTVNGVSQKTTLNLYFNCTPGEIAFTTKVNRLTDWIYDIEITLQSKGAESWLVNVKNWNTGAALLKNYSDYQYLQFKVGNYSYGDEIELVFKATNQSGYTEKSYDMPPVYQMNPGTQPVWDKISVGEAVSFEAYTLSGTPVSKVASTKLELNKTLPSGIYVIRSKDADENTIESKTAIIK
jgi:hypothetical protein